MLRPICERTNQGSKPGSKQWCFLVRYLKLVLCPVSFLSQYLQEIEETTVSLLIIDNCCVITKEQSARLKSFLTHPRLLLTKNCNLIIWT